MIHIVPGKVSANKRRRYICKVLFYWPRPCSKLWDTWEWQLGQYIGILQFVSVLDFARFVIMTHAIWPSDGILHWSTRAHTRTYIMPVCVCPGVTGHETLTKQTLWSNDKLYCACPFSMQSRFIVNLRPYYQKSQSVSFIVYFIFLTKYPFRKIFCLWCPGRIKNVDNVTFPLNTTVANNACGKDATVQTRDLSPKPLLLIQTCLLISAESPTWINNDYVPSYLHMRYWIRVYIDNTYLSI